MEELRIADGPIEVVVLPEFGARIHRLRAFGHDLLRTPADPAEHARDPFFWGAYVMAPWCGRIDPGPAEVAGRRVAARANFPDGSAIHGQVYGRPWEVRGDGTCGIRGGGDYWPWEYDVTLRVGVVAQSVHLEMALANRSTGPMPAGIGIHPWFRRPVRVAIRGDAVYRSNVASSALPEPVEGAHDLRRLGELVDGLDATWTRLADPAVELRWPGPGILATMRVTPPGVHVVAASPGHLDAIAVEPQTHAPQGLRRLLRDEPGAMAMLDPDATLELAVELAIDRL